MLKKVQQAAGDVLAKLLLERLIVFERGKTKESLAGPKRVPIPKLSECFAGLALRNARMLQKSGGRPQRSGATPAK
jgi:hypothetical protein